MRAVMAARLLTLLLAEASGACFGVAVMLFSRVADAAPDPAVVARINPWATPEMVWAVCGGAVLLLGAVAKLFQEQRANRREAKADAAELLLKVKEVKAAAHEVSAKVTEVKDLADGNTTTLMAINQRLSERVADLTRDPTDIAAAAAAKHDVAIKHEVDVDAAAKHAVAAAVGIASAKRDAADEAAKK